MEKGIQKGIQGGKATKEEEKDTTERKPVIASSTSRAERVAAKKNKIRTTEQRCRIILSQKIRILPITTAFIIEVESTTSTPIAIYI